MRTIVLIASLGLLAAAEQPTKPAKQPAPLATAERLALAELIARRGEIEKHINAIVNEGCATRGFPADRCRLREDGYFIETPPPAAPKPQEKK